MSKASKRGRARPILSRRELERLNDRERTVVERWLNFTPHPGQEWPQGDWRVWLMLAGRGFGKTRAGAEWVSHLARMEGRLRIALVGGTADEVANVMIRGQSGLMAVSAPEDDVIWRPSKGVVSFASGAQAYVYSGENPERLRGPEHHVAWCDELAKWAYPQETWDNLKLGLRLGPRQRVLVTTTPRPIATLKRIMADKETLVVRGRSADNPHLSARFLASVQAQFGGTRLGRQELEGELIEDVEGALWTRALVERCRVRARPHPPTGCAGGAVAVAPHPPTGCAGAPLPLPQGGEGLVAAARDGVRVVIGVDPPASAGGGCVRDRRGRAGRGQGRICAGRPFGERAEPRRVGAGGGGGGAGAWRRPGGGRGQPGRGDGGERAQGGRLRPAGAAGPCQPRQGGAGGAGGGLVRERPGAVRGRLSGAGG